MLCPACGKFAENKARFCPQCGQSLTAAQPPAMAPGAAGVSTQKSSTGKKIGCLVGVIFLLILGITGGIIGLILYISKNSEANRLAVATLRRDAAVREAIGEVEDVGWPLGSISTTGGGAGQASFSMSVKGSKGKGKYFATLVKENGVWRLQSARLQTAEGPSLTLGATTSPENPTVPPQASPTQGGKTLKADPSLAQAWKGLIWPKEGTSFRVPPDWMQIQLDGRGIEFRPADRSAYFIATVTYFDQKIPFENILESFLHKGKAQLQREEIAGFGLKNLGKVRGYLEITERGDGHTMASWTGYLDSPEFGTKTVTFLVGAPTRADFQRWEPALGAILDSVQFP